MTAFCFVAGQVPAERPRDGAEDRDQDDRDEPEDAEPGEDRLHEAGRDAEEREDPDADRDAAEDADDVVDRRVVGPLLVSVVEPLEPQEDDPAADGEEEREVLEAGSDPVPQAAPDGTSAFARTKARTSARTSATSSLAERERHAIAAPRTRTQLDI